MLLREVEVRLRDLRGKDEAVMLVAPGRSQLLEPLRSQHLPQGVRRIDGAVDHDVDDVDPFRDRIVDTSDSGKRSHDAYFYRSHLPRA